MREGNSVHTESDEKHTMVEVLNYVFSKTQQRIVRYTVRTIYMTKIGVPLSHHKNILAQTLQHFQHTSTVAKQTCGNNAIYTYVQLR